MRPHPGDTSLNNSIQDINSVGPINNQLYIQPYPAGKILAERDKKVKEDAIYSPSKFQITDEESIHKPQVMKKEMRVTTKPGFGANAINMAKCYDSQHKDRSTNLLTEDDLSMVTSSRIDSEIGLKPRMLKH
jgi:acetolactate synthase regulatory subunit